jgi:hypothetical protein
LGSSPGAACRVQLVQPQEQPAPLTPQRRLLLLDTWQRSGLPAGDFAALVGLSEPTLDAWKKKFAATAPGGLLDRPRGGPCGGKLPELTRRTILMLKQANPDWGSQRISDRLARGPALPASAKAGARVLHDAGYELEAPATPAHRDHVRHFERAQPNQRPDAPAARGRHRAGRAHSAGRPSVAGTRRGRAAKAPEYAADGPSAHPWAARRMAGAATA